VFPVSLVGNCVRSGKLLLAIAINDFMGDPNDAELYGSSQLLAWFCIVLFHSFFFFNIYFFIIIFFNIIFFLNFFFKGALEMLMAMKDMEGLTILCS